MNEEEKERKNTCDDAISRQAVLDVLRTMYDTHIVETDAGDEYIDYNDTVYEVEQLPSVKPQEKTGHCKECKYFEYDSMAKVDGIPLIVAHEICSRWSDGCKTKEDGYCFLFESPESEG